MDVRAARVVSALLLAAFPMRHARADSVAAHLPAVEASNTFALDTYEVLRSTDGNVVFCPFGLHRLLSLAREGAAGKTADELDHCLHWTVSRELRHSSLTALGMALGTSMQHGLLTLQTSNRLWLSSHGSLEPAFRDLAVTLYGTNAETLDFSNPDKAIAYMNAVIGGDTKGRVAALLPRDAVDAGTSLVMANTVYFKGLWISPFDKRKTTHRPFFPLDQQKSEPCVTMTQNGDLYAHEESDLQALGIPFSGASDLSMIFLLPVKRGALRELEKTLSAERIRKIADNMSATPVTAFIPKFSFSVGGGYRAILATLGVQRLFDMSRAELQGISTTANPHLGEMWHETTIEINEVGGEATAATAVPADPFGPGEPAAPGRQPVRRMLFNADHPFVFLVRHRPTGLVLFLGRFAGR
jgi:serine protease inhibitor